MELPHTLLLFDYWQGELPPLAPDKPLFVFVSHRHHDHYDPGDLAAAPSRGALCAGQCCSRTCRKSVLSVEPCRRYDWQGLTIETLRSTDEGCAFLVQAEGLHIYHAGDLNWWHWEGEPEADNVWHDKAFHAELDRIRGRRFDLAFVPLDPRQEANGWWGFADFLDACPCAHVFPMHYGADKAAALAYLQQPRLACWLPVIHTEDCWCGTTAAT